MGFWGSLFGGSSPERNALIQDYGQIGRQQTGQGQTYENKAGDFWSGLLSGDSAKQMQILSPEISAAKSSAAQENKTTSEFGTRSGGNAASTASTNDKVHGYISNLLGTLTGSSATNLANLGTTEMSTGLGALSQQGGEIEKRMQAWSDSILGKGITSAVSSAESAGLGAAGI